MSADPIYSFLLMDVVYFQKGGTHKKTTRSNWGGIRYEIKDEDIIDTSDNFTFAAVIISPFLGASGGAYEVFDVNELHPQYSVTPK